MRRQGTIKIAGGVALALLLAFAGSASAQDQVEEVYREENTTTAYRANIDDTAIVDWSGDDDVLQTTGIAIIATFTTTSSATIAVSGRHNTSGATATVYLLRGRDVSNTSWTVQDFTKATLTAETVTFTGATYPSATLLFDTGGSGSFKVLAIPSSGTLDLWVRQPGKDGR